MVVFVGCGIDNVFVELDGGEVLVMDGSLVFYVFLIECVGKFEFLVVRCCI